MDYNVATSFNRKKWFDKFKNDMEKIPKIDVVLDGANIGFANANRKINRQNVYLNAQNIEWVIKELQDLSPTVQEMPILDECCEGIHSIHIVKDTCPWLPKDYVQFHTTTYDMD